MIKIVCSYEHEIEAVDSANIVLLDDKLIPFVTRKRFSGFPPLSKNIYKWCVKNNCRYKKVHYFIPNETCLEWALLFEDADSRQKFQNYWSQRVVRFEKPFDEYEFTEKSYSWRWNGTFSREAIDWMKENKIRTSKRGNDWLLFSTAEHAMAFKLRWM